MRKHFPLCLTLAALALWCATAIAQTTAIQITKAPTANAAPAEGSRATATIEWSTNVPAGSTVLYGTDANKLDQTAQESWGGTNHKVQLNNLQPNTTYYYQVKSGEALGSGSGISSPVASFKTGANGQASQSDRRSAGATGAPTQQPSGKSETNVSLVAGPIPQRVADTTARIWWETNTPSSTILMYGTDANKMSQKKEAPWGQQSHAVDLNGLQPGATYYFQVVTSDGRTLDKGSFRTANAQAAQQKFQITHGPVIEQIAPDSVVVAWTTSAPSSSVVMYGSDPSNLNQKAEAAWGQQTHRVNIRNLSPSTKYYFQVQTGQAQGTGESVTSAVFPVTTEAAGQQARNFNTK